MNVSLAWLRSVVGALDTDVDTLVERMASLGFPVEAADPLGAPLADILVARVVEAGPHPNADRLSLCRVDAGGGEIVQVVCGAPNVRAGAAYPFIPVGGVLPGGMKIRKAKIRGEVSQGMLCSAKELGLGVDHAGILELQSDAQPGTPFASVYGLEGDVRLDVEITANRGDLLSHVGIAREVAVGGVAGVRLPEISGSAPVEYEILTDAESAKIDGVRVAIREPALCRRFLGAVVRGVRVGPSPDWLQARLRSVGARPINTVVDATNYVLFELGQPTHAYDLDKLRGREVTARRADDGEVVTTLDGVERTLEGDMLVIADGEGIVNVAGIMGDERSSVTGATTDIFLECAHFEPRSVRGTKKALGIQSDAGYRYERFVDPEAQERAFARVLEVILATAGGTLHPVVADVHADPWRAARVELRAARVERLLGVAFSAADIEALLTPLGFTVETAGDGVQVVTIPGWRGYDVTREVDLIEEIARRHGFDRFPDDAGAFRPNTVPDHPLFQLEDTLRRFLVGRGLFEAQTPAFVPPAEGEVALNNPLSREEPVLRRDLVPSLLRRLEHNLARGVRDVRLFEIATSFRARGPGLPPAEETRLVAVLTGRRSPEHWSGPEAAIDLWDIKGLLADLVARACPGARLEAGDVEGSRIEPGEGFVVVDPSGVIGFGGRVSSGVVDLPPWAGEVVALELALPAEPGAPPVPSAHALPAFPGVERDVALIVPNDVSAGGLADLARASGGGLLEAVELFDLYTGDNLPEKARSVAYRFRFRSPERTLTDDQVDRTFRSIVARLEEEPGVQVRR